MDFPSGFVAAWPYASTSSVVTMPCWWGTREAGHVPGVSSLCRRSIFTPHRLSRCSSSSNLPHPGVLGAALQAAVQYNPIYPWKCSLYASLTRIWEWKTQERHLFHNTREILDAEGSPGMHGWALTPARKSWAGTGTPQDHGQCHNTKTTKLDLQPHLSSLNPFPFRPCSAYKEFFSLSPQKAWL